MWDEILADYPLLESGDITAVLEYAAKQSDHTVSRVAFASGSTLTPNTSSC